MRSILHSAATLAAFGLLLGGAAPQALARSAPDSFADLTEKLSPAVVNISTTQFAEKRGSTEEGQKDPLEEFREFFNRRGQAPPEGGEGQQQRPQRRQSSLGSGFVIDKAGYIVTNNHVVEDADQISVILEDDTVLEATVVGRDDKVDIALLKVEPKTPLTAVNWGNSDNSRVGDWVMAIGNPFGLAHTVSVGVISAVERSFPVADGRFQQVLQTDAAINPGNSGGPLLNIRGEVVGMNTAIYSDSRASGNIGIGFAMPVNIIRELLPQLRSGKVTRGRIGVGVNAVPTNAVQELGLTSKMGALVSTVDRKGPAFKAGVEPGDVIVEFNGRPVKNNTELVAMVGATRPGTTVPFKVIRDRQSKSLNITVDELNAEAEPSAGTDTNSSDEQTSKGFGLTLGNLTPEISRRLRLENGERGAIVMDVEQGSPASRGGLTPGDIITRVNGKVVSTATQASTELNAVKAGGAARLLVLRNGQETFVIVSKE